VRHCSRSTKSLFFRSMRFPDSSSAIIRAATKRHDRALHTNLFGSRRNQKRRAPHATDRATLSNLASQRGRSVARDGAALRVNCATNLEKSGFALDSLLEEDGFELPVPLRRSVFPNRLFHRSWRQNRVETDWTQPERNQWFESGFLQRRVRVSRDFGLSRKTYNEYIGNGWPPKRDRTAEPNNKDSR
jgi:hypothetical protein